MTTICHPVAVAYLFALSQVDLSFAVARFPFPVFVGVFVSFVSFVSVRFGWLELGFKFRGEEGERLVA